MGDFRHHIAALLCAASLAGCIPATPAPPPRPAPVAPPVQQTPDFERPTWTLRPVATNAVSIPSGLYAVRPGDTLRAVGEKTGVGAEALTIENDLAPPYTLRFGQELRIPAGLYHRVGAGETGIGIAAAYGAEWGEIITINALAEPYILRYLARRPAPPPAQ